MKCDRCDNSAFEATIVVTFKAKANPSFVDARVFQVNSDADLCPSCELAMLSALRMAIAAHKDEKASQVESVTATTEACRGFRLDATGLDALPKPAPQIKLDGNGVMINGQMRIVTTNGLSYEDIAALVKIENPTITYRNQFTKESGSVYPGYYLPVKAGLIINAVNTSGA